MERPVPVLRSSQLVATALAPKWPFGTSASAKRSGCHQDHAVLFGASTAASTSHPPPTASSNFRRLVLCCIDSYDSEQRRIFLHFSRSTRFASFCTAAISNFADLLQFFSRKCSGFSGFLQFFAKFLRDFNKNQQKFDANLQNFRD